MQVPYTPETPDVKVNSVFSGPQLMPTEDLKCWGHKTSFDISIIHPGSDFNMQDLQRKRKRFRFMEAEDQLQSFNDYWGNCWLAKDTVSHLVCMKKPF